MSEEIIELDSDGSFNIPSPSRRVVDTPLVIVEPKEEEIDAKLAELNAASAFESMVAGDFKIYQDKQAFVVFIRLSPDQLPQTTSISVTDGVSKLQVKTSNAKVMSIALPANFKYDETKVESKYCNDFFTAKIPLKP